MPKTNYEILEDIKKTTEYTFINIPQDRIALSKFNQHRLINHISYWVTLHERAKKLNPGKEITRDMINKLNTKRFTKNWINSDFKFNALKTLIDTSFFLDSYKYDNSPDHLGIDGLQKLEKMKQLEGFNIEQLTYTEKLGVAYGDAIL